MDSKELEFPLSLTLGKGKGKSQMGQLVSSKEISHNPDHLLDHLEGQTRAQTMAS